MKIHLLLTLHRDIWRVRILIPGEARPRWKSYRVAEYPNPEAVARRCMAGLASNKPTDKAQKYQLGNLHSDIRPIHDSPLRQFSLEPHGKIEIENFFEKDTKPGECRQPDSDDNNQCYGENEQTSHPFLLVRWEYWGCLEPLQAYSQQPSTRHKHF